MSSCAVSICNKMIRLQFILCFPVVVMGQIPNYNRFKEYIVPAGTIGKFDQPVIIPLAYAPRDVCFNPQFHDYISHSSPLPRPNVYFAGKPNTMEFGNKLNLAGKTIYNPMCRVFGMCPGYVPAITDDMSSRGYYIQATDDLNQSFNRKSKSQSRTKQEVKRNKGNNNKFEKNEDEKNTENRINPKSKSNSNNDQISDTKINMGAINRKSLKEKQQENLVKLMNYLIDHGRNKRRTMPKVSKNNESLEEISESE